MTLRKRTLLTIGAIGLFLMVVLYTLSSTILLHSFTQLEKEDAQQGVERALAVWENALNELRLAARDWAFWDATYEFVQNGNAGYVNSNLVPQTFNNLRINLLLLVNPSGKIVFGAGFDLQNQMAAPIPPGITDYVSPGGLLQRTSAKNDMSGIIVLPDHVLLVTSWPILPTSETGESRGVLIMGRYLDEIEVERLARLTGVSVKILRFDEAVSPIDRMAIQLEALRQGGPGTRLPVGAGQPPARDRRAGHTPDGGG
jgi:sensor domain CHASE-containing protein